MKDVRKLYNHYMITMWAVISSSVMLLTGCMSVNESLVVKDILQENNVIKSDWIYIDTLRGLGYDVGGENNLPKMNTTYEIYKSGDEYVCIMIEKNEDTDNEYDVYLYDNAVEYGEYQSATTNDGKPVMTAYADVFDDYSDEYHIKNSKIQKE